MAESILQRLFKSQQLQAERDKSVFANEYAQLQNSYAPEAFRLQNLLTQEEIPYKQATTRKAISDMNINQMKVPYELQEIMEKVRGSQSQRQRNQFLNAISQRDLSSPDFKGEFGKSVNDAQMIKQIFGEKSPQYQGAVENLKRLSSGKNGVTMTIDENGRPMVQIGGSARTTAGGTFIDKDGNLVQQPTQNYLGVLQRSIAANENVQEVMKDIIPAITPYLGLTGKISGLIDANESYIFGTPNNKYADYQAALDEIEIGSENLLRASGLTVTDQSLANMKKVLMPRHNDNPANYKRRVIHHLEMERKRRLRQLQTAQKGQSFTKAEQQELKGGEETGMAIDHMQSLPQTLIGRARQLGLS